MTKAKTGLLLLAVLLLALWPGCRIIQEARWEKANEAGKKALQEGRYAEAEQHLTAALKQAEKFGEQDFRLATSLNHLASLYNAQGRYDEAIASYKRAVKLKPDYVYVLYSLGVAHYNLGVDYESKGLYDEAIASYERAVKLKPDYAKALNNLGWVYATAKDPQVRNARKALEYAKKAVRITPNDAAHLDTLAEAYYSNNQFDKAIETEKKALSLRPHDTVLQQQLKKFEEAKRAKRH